MTLPTFQPSLFIQLGKKGNYYTLRQTYRATRVIEGVEYFDHVGSEYIKTLSQNADVALTKAQDYAKKVNLPLKDIRDLNVKTNKIKRIDKASLPQYSAEEQERLNREFKEKHIAHINNVLEKGQIPFGQHKGRPISEVSQNFLTWLIREHADTPENSPYYMSDKAITARFIKQHKELYIYSQDKVGEVGERKDFSVRIISQKIIPIKNNPFADRTVLYTFIDEQNRILITFTPRLLGKDGDRINFRATIKEHSKFNEQTQTVLSNLRR